MSAPVWIEERDALALHGMALARYGGRDGLRDREALRMVLSHPQEHYAYVGTADLAELAAAYTAGIVRNRPFAEGNRATGFLIGALFLEINGLRLTAPEALAAQAIIALASEGLNEIGFVNFLRAHAAESSQPAE
jgi:death on curing protein